MKNIDFNVLKLLIIKKIVENHDFFYNFFNFTLLTIR